MTVREADIDDALKAEMTRRLRDTAHDLAVTHCAPVAAVLRALEIEIGLMLSESAQSYAGGADKLRGVAEIAAFVGVSSVTLRRMVYAGEIPVHRDTSNRWWASRSELATWEWSPSDHDRLIGLPAIAACTGVSVETIKNYLATPGKAFPARRVGGRWWASRAAVIGWLEAS